MLHNTFANIQTSIFFPHSAITCSALSVISNGAISYTPDTTEPHDFETDAIHSCSVGYYLQGGAIRSCEGDGSSPIGMWSGEEPDCIGNK